MRDELRRRRVQRRSRRTEETDNELLAEAAQGDPEAFECLVRRHLPLLQAACADCFDATDREDALQAGLVDIWRGCQSFRGEAKVSTWMYAIVRNAAKRSGRRGRSVHYAVVSEVPEVSPVLPDWEDLSSTRAVTRAAILALPPDHREALLLHVEAGLSMQEIADMKIVAVGTVKSWIHRARKDLARAITEADR